MIAAAPRPGHLLGPPGDLPDRQAGGVGVGGEPALAGAADAPPRRVDDPREGDLVGGVDEQAEVGDRVLDLGPLVELGAADHLVGELEADQRVLQHPAHRVGPVEDRDVLAPHPLLLAEALDLARHPARLLVLVGQLRELHRLAAGALGPEPLRPTLAVALDHRVGGGEDRLGGAVVLLQLDHRSIGEVALEVEDVADVGVAESVDRLVLVADDHQVAVLGGEQLQQPVLGVVGVLVLVDEDVAEGAAPAVADLLEQLHRVDGADQQVVEVHRVRVQHPLLVEREGLGDDLLEGAARAFRRRRRRRSAGSWRRRSASGPPAAGSASGRRQLREAAFQHPPRVRLVVDREAPRVAEPLGVGAQHPRAGRVEGRHPHRPCRAPDQPLDPLAHLRRRLVGEGDREDLVGPGGAGHEQVAIRWVMTRVLPEPAPASDQQRPLAVEDRLPLGVVEPGQQPLDVVGPALSAGLGAWGGPVGSRTRTAASPSRIEGIGGRGQPPADERPVRERISDVPDRLAAAVELGQPALEVGDPLRESLDRLGDRVRQVDPVRVRALDPLALDPDRVAGVADDRAPGGTSSTTTVLAPILAPSPTAIGRSSLAPEPTVTLSPSVGWRLPR